MKKLTTKQKKILHVISMDTDVQKLWDFINDGLENKDIIIWKLAFHLARKDLLKIYGGVLFDKAEQEGKPININGFFTDELDFAGWGFTNPDGKKVIKYLHDYGLIREHEKANLIY